MVRPGMKSGVHTAPTVYVRATSGTRLALPWLLKVVVLLWKVVGPVGTCRSVKTFCTKVAGRNKSSRVGARMSIEVVPRKRKLSTTFQLKPSFQVWTEPDTE